MILCRHVLWRVSKGGGLAFGAAALVQQGLAVKQSRREASRWWLGPRAFGAASGGTLALRGRGERCCAVPAAAVAALCRRALRALLLLGRRRSSRPAQSQPRRLAQQAATSAQLRCSRLQASRPTPGAGHARHQQHSRLDRASSSNRLQVARAQMTSLAHNIGGKFALGHSFLMLFFAKGHYSNAPLPIDTIVLSLFAGGHWR